MFLLLGASLLFLIPVFRGAAKLPRHVYQQLENYAVYKDKEFDITCPEDLPDDIDFYIMSYSVGDLLFKLCRNSLTVPQHIKKRQSLRKLTDAIAIDELGQTYNVTKVISSYCGPSANFSGHDISLIKILSYHGFHNISSVVTISRPISNFSFLYKPRISLHTNITISELKFSGPYALY
jgi:hypothetical protein